MPLYKHSEIIPKTFLLIWEITETKNMLLKNLKNINQLTLKLSHLKSNSHKLQFLSNLQLMKLKNISFEDLDYNVNGKPSYFKIFMLSWKLLETLFWLVWFEMEKRFL